MLPVAQKETTTAATIMSKPDILKVKFEGFEDLPSGRDECTAKQLTDSHGNKWKLKLYPGGKYEDDEGFVSVYIVNLGEKDIDAKYSIILRNERGKIFKERGAPSIRTFMKRGVDSWGRHRIVSRSVLLDRENDILLDGALLLDLELQYKQQSPIHDHPSFLSKNMLQLLEKEEDVNVTYEVDGTTFRAHKLILKVNAPVLFNLCEEIYDGSPVPINGTTPEIFLILLRYAYGEEIPKKKVILSDGKEIIDAANKYGVVGLKIAVETVLVESLVINVENVADWLIFSDAKMCPSLKEHATAYFACRTQDILNSESSHGLKESNKLLTELMMEISNSSNDDRFSNGRDASVDELRKQLLEKGLDIDGSKEMLISRLRESKKRKRDE